MTAASVPAATASQPTGVGRIAVVRALPGLGDLLCLVPALRAVRSAHPDAEVTLVGLPTAGWFVERFPHLVDDLAVVAGVPGLAEIEPDAEAALRFFAAVRRSRFDLALQLHGSGVVTNPLTTMLGAWHQVTARLPGQWRPPGTAIDYPTTGPEIHRLLAVVRAAGCPPAGVEVELPVTRAEQAAARSLVGGPNGTVTPYACLHPGAARTDNRWSPMHFAAVGDRLAAAGLRVVLTGTDGDRAAVAAVGGAMAAPALDLHGRTDVGTLGALYASAELVVSNDTGAAHVAAAVRAPSVVVFPAGGDPDRWAPLDAGRHRRLVADVHDDGDGWPGTGAVLRAVDDQLAATTHLAVATGEAT